MFSIILLLMALMMIYPNNSPRSRVEFSHQGIPCVRGFIFGSNVMGCIYLVTNKINDKQYVGKTIYTMKNRKDCHIRSAGMGSTVYFHRALRKYELNAFVWTVLEENELEYMLNAMEKLYIRKLCTKAPNGYNLTDGGEGASGLVRIEEVRERIRNTLIGRHHSEEAKKKMKIARKKQKYTEEHRRNIGNSSRGRKHSEETKKRLGNASRGRKHSEETKRKMSMSQKERLRSEEARKKSGDTRRGQKRSEESKKKMSDAHKGHRHSEETRRKMSNAHKGQTPSEETKRKISVSEKKTKSLLRVKK